MRYNDGFTQILIVSVVAFCCPGIFNAMNGLGGAGDSTGDAASIANATLYACFAVFGYFGGAFFNKLGNRVLVVVGGLTYAFYSFGMYMCGTHDKMEWLAALSGGILGFGAGWFWTAQGAMMMSYATASTKGKFISIFWVIFNLGGMVGGFIAFGLNFHEEQAKANPASYFTFVGLMIFGALGGLALLPPNKVQRADGTTVKFDTAPSVKEEVMGAISVTCHKYMIILAIPFLASNWFYTYQFSGFNLNIFTTRTRGFNSALYWGSQMLGSYILGLCLDNQKWTRRNRGWVSLILSMFILHLAFALGCIIQYGYEGGFERSHPPAYKTIDFTESGRFAFPIIVYILYGMGDAMFQTYIYWVMASLAGSDTKLCARYAGFYKGVQSAGAAVAWGIDLKVDYIPQFWICWVLCILATPLLALSNMGISEVMDEDEKMEEGSIVAGQKETDSADDMKDIEFATQAAPLHATEPAAKAEPPQQQTSGNGSQLEHDANAEPIQT